jgi:hypothetical protein
VNFVLAYHPGDDRTGMNADAQPQLWMFGPLGFQVALHGHRHFDGRLGVVRTQFRKASDDDERIADSWRCQPSGTGNKAASVEGLFHSRR